MTRRSGQLSKIGNVPNAADFHTIHDTNAMQIRKSAETVREVEVEEERAV